MQEEGWRPSITVKQIMLGIQVRSNLGSPQLMQGGHGVFQHHLFEMWSTSITMNQLQLWQRETGIGTCIASISGPIQCLRFCLMAKVADA